MAEISHLAEARTRLSRTEWPRITFCFHVKAAEVAAEVTSLAAVSTKMVAGRSISAHHRVTALQFLLFMFLCTYSTILDLGYVNFLARGTDDCARRRISGVDATISLQFIGNAVKSKKAKLHSIFPEPSSALIACIRDSRSATTLQQKGFTVRGFYGIAAQLYSLSAEVFGAVPISAAIVSDLTAGVGGSLPSQRDAAGDDKVSCEVSIAKLARRSLNIEILRENNMSDFR